MNSCLAFEEMIDRVQTGESDAAERELLLDHLDHCSSCSDLFELIGRVRAEESDGESIDPMEPTPLELARMRRSVLAAIGDGPGRARATVGGGGRPGLRPALALAASLALAALGFALGAGWRTEDSPNVASAPSGPGAWDAGGRSAVADGSLASQVRLAAARHSTFEEISDSPFVFANVRAEPAADGRVHLAFDVSRHLDLVVDRGDPLLAEALVQTLVEPGSLGSRLAAIELAGDRLEPKVKQALLLAMRTDESLGVRLKAQERLTQTGADPQVTDAMLDLLEHEEAVQMRLLAIDYLAAHGVRPDRLERALAGDEATLAGGPDRALQVRAAAYLKKNL